MTIKTTKRYYQFRLYDYYQNRSPQLQLLTNVQRIATDSMNGTDLPNYRTVISQGNSAVNNLSASRTRITYRKGYASTETKNSAKGPTYSGWTESIEPVPYVVTRNVPQPLIDSADNTAKIEVIKKIKSQMEFNGPVVLGELKETIGWIKSPASALRSAFYGFFDKHNRKLFDLSQDMSRAVNKRSKRKLVDRYTKDLADDYMELTFAVNPLIGTIKDITNAALAKFQTNKLKRVSASIPRQSAKYISTGYLGTGAISLAHRYDILQEDRVLVNYVAWCKENIPNTENALLRVYESSGMRLGELPGVAWELFPLSWMYDYFLNIGDLLACNFNYNAQVGFAKRAVTQDVIDVAVNFHHKRSGVGLIWVNSSFQPPYMLSHTRTFSRTKLADLGNVSPRFEFSLPGSTGQFLNMAGLARQRFDKCFNQWRSIKI